jgi:hypothetical protein
MLRMAFPRSAYVPDSYYWHAFALQRMEDARSLRDALTVLDEQQLRFPESASGDDVVALRRRIESLVSREPASAFTAPAACTDRDEKLAVQALSSLSQITDAESIRGYLASLLAMRTPCARELRRSAVYLLAMRPEAEARRMLGVVVEKDPDQVVRTDAQAALAKPTRQLTASPRLVPPHRRAADTAVRVFGDTVNAGVLHVGARKDSKVVIERSLPTQLLVVAVTPGEPLELLSPSSLAEARRVSAGVATVDARALDAPSRVMASSFSTADQQAFDFRMQAQLDACMAQQTAKAQAALDRQWNAKPSQAGKPVIQQPVGGPIDYAQAGNIGLLAARATCNQRASRVAPPPPVTTVLREELTQPPTKGDRYLLVLATTRPVSLPWLIVRIGTVESTGVTMMEIMDRISSTLFAGHPGAWSGAVVPW